MKLLLFFYCSLWALAHHRYHKAQIFKDCVAVYAFQTFSIPGLFSG